MSRKQPTPAPAMECRPAPPPAPPSVSLPITSIVWHPVATDPPPNGAVVLIVGDDGYVWVGFKGADTWYDATDNRPMPAPRRWACFPEGPA